MNLWATLADVVLPTCIIAIVITVTANLVIHYVREMFEE